MISQVLCFGKVTHTANPCMNSRIIFGSIKENEGFKINKEKNFALQDPSNKKCVSATTTKYSPEAVAQRCSVQRCS